MMISPYFCCFSRSLALTWFAKVQALLSLMGAVRVHCRCQRRVAITRNSAVLRQWLSRLLAPGVSALFSASLPQGPACGADLMRTSLSERWTQAVLLCPRGCPHPSLSGTEGGAVCWPALAEDSRQGESCSGLCRITWKRKEMVCLCSSTYRSDSLKPHGLTALGTETSPRTVSVICLQLRIVQ